MSNNRIPNVLFVDDENSILKLIEIQTLGVVNHFFAKNVAEALDILAKEDINIIVTDQHLDNGEKGTDILTQVYIEFPHIRRIVLTSDLSLNTVLVSINETSVHRYLIKPWKKDTLLDMINSQFTIFLEEERKTQEFKDLKSITQFLRKKVYSNSSEMLSHILNPEPIKNSNEFMAEMTVVVGNLVEIAKQFVLSFESNYNFELIADALGTIGDIELFASEYSMRDLKVYAKLLQGYTQMISGVFQNLEILTNEIHRLIYVDQRENLPSILQNECTTFVNLVDSIRNESVDLKIEDTFYNINALFNYDVSQFVQFSPIVFRFVKETAEPISHLAIVKDGNTIFSMVDGVINPIIGTHIGSFVVALQDFFEVVLESSGRIESINHDKGVVEIYKDNTISYVVLSSQKSIYHRLAFRKFIEETIDMIRQLPNGMTLRSDEEQIIIGKLNQNFNCKISIVNF